MGSLDHSGELERFAGNEMRGDRQGRSGWKSRRKWAVLALALVLVIVAIVIPLWIRKVQTRRRRVNSSQSNGEEVIGAPDVKESPMPPPTATWPTTQTMPSTPQRTPRTLMPTTSSQMTTTSMAPTMTMTTMPTTSKPIPAPSPNPVTTPKPSTSLPLSSPIACDTEFECKTDRLGHFAKLYSGQALCNNEIRFGLTRNATFLLYNCTAEQARVIYEPSQSLAKAPGQVYFVMDEVATLRLHDGSDSDKLLYIKDSNRVIHPYAQCLRKPLLDCPYIHLHPDAVIVLNWIDASMGWEAHGFVSCFDNLFLE